MSISLKSPCTVLIAGMTSSGKTYFTNQIIENKEHVFDISPKKILFLYSAWQSLYDEMEKQYQNSIIFYNGLPTEEYLNEYLKDKCHKLVVIDDLMIEASNSALINDLFYKKSHHNNSSVILLTQNIYNKNLRGIGLNCHYIVFFKSPRSHDQISKLGSQIGCTNLLKQVYKDICKRNYGYILIDLHPSSDKMYMFRTDIFPDQDTIVYQ